MFWRFFRKRPVPSVVTSVTQSPVQATAPAEPVQKRPSVSPIATLTQIVGQKNVVSRLTAICEFSRSIKGAAEHLLLIGPDGTGKRTIGQAFAGECGVEVKEVDATKIERKGDLTAVLTSLEPRQVLLMHNIGSLRPDMREIFLTALQHYRLDLLIGKEGRKHPYQLSRFTCIAITVRECDCPPELRGAFALAIPIEPYTQTELEALTTLIAAKAGASIDPGAAKLIVGTCGGNPHRLEIMIQRLAKLSPGVIAEGSTREILSAYGITSPTTRLSGPVRDLQNLTGIQFEELITSLLARLGFRAQMTKASGDGGIDIIAVLDTPVIGGKYLFQCKRFASNTLVGAPVVREFYGAVSADRKAIKGTLVTTSGFTEQARAFAQDVGIELIDMEQLSRLLIEQGIHVSDPVKPLFPIESPQVKKKDLF